MEQLIYIIDHIRSDEDKALAIKIQRAGMGSQPLTRAQLQTLSSSRDATLIPFLIKEELAYVKKKSGRNFEDPKADYSTVRIAYSQVSEAFKFFALNGKLHFNGKSLVVDLYGKSTFYYTVENQLVEGKIKTDTQEFSITTCDYVGRGSPHWYIKGSSLKFISTDISWSDLNDSFKNKNRHYQELMEEADEDTEAPRVVVTGEMTIPVNEPLPILILKDRHGSFADLFLSYSNHEKTSFEEVDFHDPQSSTSFGKRQIPTEQQWERDLIETGFIKKPLATSRYYCPLDKVAKSLAFLLELGWQVRDFRGNRVVQHSGTHLSASTETPETIILKGKLSFSTFEADIASIVGAFNKRERFAEIAPGHVALLPSNLSEINLGDLAEDGEIVGDTIRLKHSQLGTLSTIFENQGSATLDKTLTTLKEKISSFEKISEALPGERFSGTLRPYQQQGLNWLAFLYDFGCHGLLADDMGLGKTVQVIAFLSRLRSDAGPILLVMPTSLIFNWKRELEKFLPGSDIVIHHGTERTGELDHPSRIILTTYTTLRLDAPLFEKIHFECIFLDEAQAIKNASTQTAKVLSRFKSRFRLSITGTPVENHLMELWSHYKFLIPDLFGDEASFRTEIQSGASDPRFLRRIRRMIRPFLMRRRKEEVAKDLPEKIEQIIWVPMEEKQRALYEEFLSGARKKASLADTGKKRMEILEAIMRLRQICCHPFLVNQSEGNEISASSKLEALLEDIETAMEEGRKMLVYSQFTGMLSLIGKALQERGVKYAYLDGSTKNREAVVNEFQTDPALQVFLISLKAGGVGLNLTAADYVFLYDPWWNAAAENQAIDRAHRIGRRDTVIAKRYVVAESIEEKMMKLKEAKSALAADLLDEEGTMSATLSMDDLLFLLS